MRSLPYGKILGLAVIMSGFACHPKNAERSKTSHTPGRFFNDNNPLQWTAIDDARWVELESGGQPTYPAQHPMTQRLQAWADEIRRNMLKSTPGLSVTPRPIIRIIDSQEVNAYSANDAVCIHVPVATGPDAAVDPNSTEYFKIEDDSQVFVDPRPEKCSEVEGDLGAKQQAVQFAFRNKEGCNVTIDGERLVLSAACTSPSIFSANAVSGLTFNATHNYITISSQLIRMLKEQEMVGVIAHELGHYYIRPFHELLT
ncbi:MAG: M48 family metallopeptidase, partial [Pseudobdellovibrionaceae bacterium]|nr:M48 family metallopeptidase [Pseudobdellovibrionaceae bacterium]